MSLRPIQGQIKNSGPSSIVYYLKQINTNAIIDVVDYHDIVGSFYIKPLGLDNVINMLLENKSTHVLYTACDHPADDIHINIKLLGESLPNTKIFTITGNGNYFNSTDTQVMYYPFYWYAFLPGPQKRYPAWIKNTDNFNSPRPYAASCLNNLCRFHRIKLLDRFF